MRDSNFTRIYISGLFDIHTDIINNNRIISIQLIYTSVDVHFRVIFEHCG
jgi:hypothetical protein